MRKILPIFLISVATFILLAHSIVPHHHHEDSLCFESSEKHHHDTHCHEHHSHSENHSHSDDENKSHGNPKCCILFQLDILPTGQDKIQLKTTETQLLAQVILPYLLQGAVEDKLEQVKIRYYSFNDLPLLQEIVVSTISHRGPPSC